MRLHGLPQHAFKTRLARIAHHPLFTVITGLGLLLAGVMEALEQLLVDFEGVFEIHHSMILLGFVTLLQALAEMVEGVEWLSKGADEEVV